MTEELAGPWQARRKSALPQRRARKRHRAAGATRKRELVFTDRVLVALVHLRTQLPHAALAGLYGVGRSTVTETIGEIRPLLATAASPSSTSPDCACERWPTCSPTPMRRA
ncbi:transposase family protein [Streptomyces sp. NPDC005784]|uniref:helix-turn-helix domain-containing protein n=1 Tax=Streptomyces sp. NPDC005784 TaxID=3364731 RepID=UPI0036C84ED9